MAAGDVILMYKFPALDLEPLLVITEGGTVWNRNALSSDVGSPRGWLRNCLEITHKAGQRGFADKAIPDLPDDKVFCWEYIFITESMADSGVANVQSFKHDSGGVNDLVARFQLSQTAGTLFLFGFVEYDGTAQLPVVVPYVIPQKMRVEFEWNLGPSKIWTVWIDGVLNQTGFITGLPASTPWQITDPQPGGIAIDTADAIHRQSNILCYEGPRDATKFDHVFGGSSFTRRARRSRR